MSDMDFSSLTDYAGSLLSNAQSSSNINSIRKSVSSVNANSTDDELLGACKQFESYLWEQILKEVDKSVNLFGIDSESGSYASNMVNVFSDSLIQDLSDKLTSGKENTLAMTLYEQLKRNYGIGTVTPEQIDAAQASEEAAKAGIVTTEE